MNATVASPTATWAGLGIPSIVTRASTGPSTIATLPPETTSRWVSPVALKSRSTPSSRCESSPSARPMSSPASRGGNTASIERPIVVRTACVARTKGLGEPATRSIVDARSVTATPLAWIASRKSGSSGISSEPSARTRSPRVAVGGSESPESQIVSRSVWTLPAARTSLTSASACQPSAPGRGSSRRVASTSARPGATAPSGDAARRASDRIAQAEPTLATPTTARTTTIGADPPCSRRGAATRSSAWAGRRSSGTSPASATGSERLTAGAASVAETIEATPRTPGIHAATPVAGPNPSSRPIQKAAVATGRSQALIS